MAQYDYILAIDPDTDKSGLATLTLCTKDVMVESMYFPSIVERLSRLKDLYPNSLVVVEAGWLNESNWHLKKGESARMAAAKGNAVGRNHETGRKIIEMAKHYGLHVKEVKPLKKCWKGRDGKISHEELAYFVPGLPSRTNQETRDAVLLSWVEAGFPIRVKPVKGKMYVV